MPPKANIDIYDLGEGLSKVISCELAVGPDAFCM